MQSSRFNVIASILNYFSANAERREGVSRSPAGAAKPKKYLLAMAVLTL